MREPAEPTGEQANVTTTELVQADALPGRQEPVVALREAIARMGDSVRLLAEQGDYESLVRGLEPLQQVIGDLRVIEHDAKRFIADTMPDRRVTVEGVGTVERRAKITRKNWDSDELLRKIVAAAVVNPETGEIPNSPMEAADRILQEIRACLPITGSLGWRLGALRERGYDPDEWCQEHRDGYTISLSKVREKP
jgi:hypothetical protein